MRRMNSFRVVDEDDDRPDRPKYLDLVGQSGSTPVVSRKPCFQFSLAANSYELNNLDNEALDAPIYTGKINNNNIENLENYNSLPCETFLVACMTESDLNVKSEKFCHKNPMYQSAVIQCSSSSSGSGKGGDTMQHHQQQQQPPIVQEAKKDGMYHI